MKFRRNMVLEVSPERITGIEFSKNIILNKALKIACTNTYDRDITNIKDFEIDIRDKNLYILVEGESVYIKIITLPLVKKHLINDLIKNELRYYYKDIDNIAFTYKLIKKNKSNMEILVYCLKGDNLAILEKCVDNNINLKTVNIIQFCLKDYYGSRIVEKNYILIFNYNFNLYFLICQSDEIVSNAITSVKELVPLKFSFVVEEFLEQYSDYAKLCNKIYFANIGELNLNIIEFKKLTLPYLILDDIKHEELIKYIIKKG